jgi:hypothetical protein
VFSPLFLLIIIIIFFPSEVFKYVNENKVLGFFIDIFLFECNKNGQTSILGSMLFWQKINKKSENFGFSFCSVNFTNFLIFWKILPNFFIEKALKNNNP